MTQTKNATLKAQTEHLTPEQTALFATLNATQQTAFLEAFPAPEENTGALWLNITFRGKKFVGIPSWMMATKLMGASRSADIMDAASAAIKNGVVDPDTGLPITRDTFNSELKVEFVHGTDDGDVVVGGVVLDTGAAHEARAARDKEYRDANPRQSGNGVAQVFTPVAQMP